ncbi:MAG: SPFH domain-containing protein [Candidatus Bathyarchaeia archaeon]
MGETVEADVVRRGEEYSGSPAPFAFFLVLFLVFLVLAILAFPYPISALFGGIALVSAVFLPGSVAINKEWEEAIILRFGKFQRLVGLGFFFKWPLAESFLKQDKRIITLDVSRQEVMTKDNISVSVDAVVFMKVVNTKDSLVNIQNVWNSAMKYAQTTMRDVVGDVELDELLAQATVINMVRRKMTIFSKMMSETQPIHIDHQTYNKEPARPLRTSGCECKMTHK